MSERFPLKAKAFRTGSLAAAALGLLACVLAAPAAGAAPPASTTTYSAVGSWVVAGPPQLNVSLQATEVSGPTGTSLFFLVSENYCNTTTGQGIYETFYVNSTVSPSFFVVSHTLSTAVLAIPGLQVSGSEQIFPTCSPTGGEQGQTVSLGTSTVILAGLWRATGPAATTFPGETVRPATAAVGEFSLGPLDLGLLGPPTYADISSYTAPAT